MSFIQSESTEMRAIHMGHESVELYLQMRGSRVSEKEREKANGKLVALNDAEQVINTRDNAWCVCSIPTARSLVVCRAVQCILHCVYNCKMEMHF